MTEYQKFFMEDVPRKLKRIDLDLKPKWGRISAAAMLYRLKTEVVLSLENVDGEVCCSHEELAEYRKLLAAKKPFDKGFPELENSLDEEIAEDNLSNIDRLKLELLKQLLDMICYFEKHTDHTAVHPHFGRLGTKEWQRLHRKHLEHRFSQFGINDL